MAAVDACVEAGALARSSSEHPQSGGRGLVQVRAEWAAASQAQISLPIVIW